MNSFMPKIKKLPDFLIGKIAAGEVIERPAYAVKELIENSLDANATSITIDIEESGLKKISITDNGEGMSSEDIAECYKSHTTSKISEEDTLTGIRSFGFRGEALSSIASISHVTIQSRTVDESGGTQIKIKNGIFDSVAPVGIPVGTTITAQHLFNAVPARKKFLKSSRTEFRHILDVVTKYALAFPDIRIKLTHNGKSIIDLVETDDISRRVKFLFGDLIHNNLLPFSFEDGYIKIDGFIGHPQIATTKPSKQYIFVNGRSVNNKVISTAISESFDTLLPRDQYPAFVVYLSIPHEAVDVNVHPRKELITFFDDKRVFDTVKNTTSESLAKHNLTFHSIPWKLRDRRITESFAGNILREESQNWDITHLGKIESGSGLLQLHNTYIVTQTAQGVILIDQHAAHERILYEKLLASFQKLKKADKSKKLEKRLPIELPVGDSEILRQYLDTLKKLGFDIEEFYENTFRVNAVPSLLKDRDIQKTINELLEDLLEKNTLSDIDSLSKKMIAYLACRSAVMAGDKLSQKQMQELIENLEKTPNNFTCPHGRPTKIEVSIKELNTLFKRI